jgi:signal transduction histidine kinase
MLREVIAEAEQRVESQAALLELQEQLLATDRMVAMGTLAAGVAHEINNPLAYVILNRDLLATEWVGEVASGPISQVARRLAVMEEGLERVRAIVADLNTYAKPETDADSNLCAHLSDVLQSAIAIAGNTIRNRAVLHQEIDPNAMVQGNGRRLEQVFLNMLVNAAQSIPEGDSSNQRIGIITRIGSDTAIIEISDTGQGIPSEHLDRVFDPFYTTKPAGEGTGLGLAISQSIVAISGGSLSIASTVGEGTTVTTRLPLVSSQVDTAESDEATNDLERDLLGA